MNNLPQNMYMEHNASEGTYSLYVEGEKEPVSVVYAVQNADSEGNQVSLVMYVETREDKRGKGMAGLIMRAALIHMQTNGVAMIPLCAFARMWMVNHPEYDDVLYMNGKEYMEQVRAKAKADGRVARAITIPEREAMEAKQAGHLH